MPNRRVFLKTTVSSLLTSFASVPSLFGSVHSSTTSKTMKLRWLPYTLQLQHPFTVAVASRTTTPVVLTEIEYDGIVGYGEASLPPYLGETQETVHQFLQQVNLSKYDTPFELERILTDIDALAPGNTAAKASVDIALHDLVGKLLQRPWYELWGFSRENTPYTSFTIGIDTPDVVRKKTEEARNYKILKVKLGRDNDKEMIETIRSVTDKPLFTDVNQGWKDKTYALDMIFWLHEKGVLLVEQPLPKNQRDDLAWLTERSPLPIIGDEGVQRLADVPAAVGVYHGINIKLMKCTGMREAHKMLLLARSLGLKVMIGCMTETSCAISAASHLTPLADWADLDGALLITNDVFEGTTIVNGKIVLSERPGIGIRKKQG